MVDQHRTVLPEEHVKYIKKTVIIIRQRRYLSLVILFILVFVLSSIALRYTNAYSTHYIDQETSSLRNEQAHLMKNINLLTNPKDLRLNDPAVTSSLIATTQTAAQEIEQSADAMQQRLEHPWLAAFSSEYDLSKARESHLILQTETHNIYTAANAYANTLVALEQFFVYNPAVDTDKLSLGSSDANKRMKRLRGGLKEAKAGVIVYSNDYGYAGDILALLVSAEAAQTKLEETGDTDDFIATFTQLQKEAQTILASHYDTMQPRLHEQAVNIIRTLP